MGSGGLVRNFTLFTPKEAKKITAWEKSLIVEQESLNVHSNTIKFS